MMYPYYSLSEYSRRNGHTNEIFYSPESNAKLVTCPFDPAHPAGSCVRLVSICLLVKCPGHADHKTGVFRDHGRMTSERVTFDEKGGFYDTACQHHKPAGERAPWPETYTRATEAATCYECRKAQGITVLEAVPSTPPPSSENGE